MSSLIRLLYFIILSSSFFFFYFLPLLCITQTTLPFFSAISTEQPHLSWHTDPLLLFTTMVCRIIPWMTSSHITSISAFGAYLKDNSNNRHVEDDRSTIHIISPTMPPSNRSNISISVKSSSSSTSSSSSSFQSKDDADTESENLIADESDSLLMDKNATTYLSIPSSGNDNALQRVTSATSPSRFMQVVHFSCAHK